MKKWKLAGINFDHFHMGDLLRYAHEHPHAEIVGIAGEAKLADGFLHAGGLLVRDANDLGVGMFVGVAEQVAHVEVVEVDAGDFPGLAFHR